MSGVSFYNTNEKLTLNRIKRLNSHLKTSENYQHNPMRPPKIQWRNVSYPVSKIISYVM